MRTTDRPGRLRRMHGWVLADLMVGMALGLLVVLAALAASATTLAAAAAGRDAAELQQRADTALRLIGQVVQQAGAVRLQGDASSGVHFSDQFDGWSGAGRVVSGLEGGPGQPDTLRLSLEPGPDDRNCIGETPWPKGGGPADIEPHLDSAFFIAIDSTDGRRPALYCEGSKANAGRQPMVSGVDDMQLLYAVADSSGQLNWVTGDALAPSSAVRAVSVCLQVSGELRQGAAPALDCRGEPIGKSVHAGRAVRLARAIFQVRNARG